MEPNCLPQKTLLRPDEVALFLSVSRKTIYRWHGRGMIERDEAKQSAETLPGFGREDGRGE